MGRVRCILSGSSFTSRMYPPHTPSHICINHCVACLTSCMAASKSSDGVAGSICDTANSQPAHVCTCSVQSRHDMPGRMSRGRNVPHLLYGGTALVGGRRGHGRRRWGCGRCVGFRWPCGRRRPGVPVFRATFCPVVVAGAVVTAALGAAGSPVCAAGCWAPGLLGSVGTYIHMGAALLTLAAVPAREDVAGCSARASRCAPLSPPQLPLRTPLAPPRRGPLQPCRSLPFHGWAAAGQRYSHSLRLAA